MRRPGQPRVLCPGWLLRLFGCLLCLHLGAAAALAAEAGPSARAGLQLESLLRDGLEAEGLRTDLRWSGGRLELEARAERIRLPEPFGTVQAARVECAHLRLTPGGLRCDDARLWGRSGELALHGHPVRLAWERASGRVTLAGAWPGWFGGRGDFHASFEPTRGWRVRADLRGLELPALATFDRLPLELPVELQRGRGDLALHWDQAGPLQAEVAVHGLAFSDAAGLRAGEDLAGRLRLGGDGRRWDLGLTLEEGVAFVSPVFVDLDSDGPLTLEVDRLHLDLPDRAGAAARARLDWDGVASAEAEAPAFDPTAGIDGAFRARVQRPAPLYEAVLAPLLAGTPLGELEAAGELTGALELQGSRPQSAWLRWHGVDLEDRRGRYGLFGAQGELDWSAAAPGSPGALRVEGAHVYGLPLDAFVARLRALPAGIELLEGTEIPVLDGALRVAALRLLQTADGPDVHFEGGIRAISLEPMTQVLGWPRVSGQLAGVIPRVRYERGDLNVDGRLLVQVFDGEVLLRDVYVHELFGRAPELGLSATIERLELERLTRAFDLGRVQGRISGHVNDLVMIDWSPVHMDLELMTPDVDPGRRRISQRAVENITELGGGLQAAASMFFLQMFENFAYRRLGFRCELRGEVCTAAGVADRPDGGFVLVQGGGLPRIDVIGYNRRVDWPELMARLAAIEGGPVNAPGM